MLEANKAIKRENKAMAKIHANKLQELNLAEVIQKLKDRENNRKKYYTIAVEILEQKKFNANGDKKTYETTRVYEDVIRAKNKNDVKKLIKMQIDEFYPYDDSNCVVSCVSFTFKISKNSSKKVNKLDVPMKRGTPHTASFLKYFPKLTPSPIRILRATA